MVAIRLGSLLADRSVCRLAGPLQSRTSRTGRHRVADVPTLILVGDRDPLRAVSPALLERFSNASLHVVPGALHSALSLGQCIADFEAEFVDTLQLPEDKPCAPADRVSPCIPSRALACSPPSAPGGRDRRSGRHRSRTYRWSRRPGFDRNHVARPSTRQR
jgi:hypothetical protein